MYYKVYEYIPYKCHTFIIQILYIDIDWYRFCSSLFRSPCNAAAVCFCNLSALPWFKYTFGLYWGNIWWRDSNIHYELNQLQKPVQCSLVSKASCISNREDILTNILLFCIDYSLRVERWRFRAWSCYILKISFE